MSWPDLHPGPGAPAKVNQARQHSFFFLLARREFKRDAAKAQCATSARMPLHRNTHARVQRGARTAAAKAQAGSRTNVGLWGSTAADLSSENDQVLPSTADTAGVDGLDWTKHVMQATQSVKEKTSFGKRKPNLLICITIKLRHILCLLKIALGENRAR